MILYYFFRVASFLAGDRGHVRNDGGVRFVIAKAKLEAIQDCAQTWIASFLAMTRWGVFGGV
jgi:hypothetical protein